MFSKDQITLMLKLQCTANDAMSKEWRTSDDNSIAYFRAINLELGECLDWMGYKWWKATAPNLPQAQMELIDVLHFVLSNHLRRQEGSVVDTAELICSQPLPRIDDVEHFMAMGADRHWKVYAKLTYQECLEVAQREALNNRDLSFPSMCRLFQRFGMTAQQVMNMYVGKNILNLFRTSNGQLNNTYPKIWWGKEDNEFLMQWLDQNEGVAMNEEFFVKTDAHLLQLLTDAKAQEQVEFK